MNPGPAITCIHTFLRRSPRTALEAQVWLDDQPWSWRYGLAERVPLPVFEIGSVGKTFTTTLLALLVQRRQISLADPVARFCPALPWASHVSLQQLASHTSGLPANPFNQWQLFRRGRQLAEAFREADLFEFLRQLPAELKPGRKARYSNVGMALLGRILGDVCGQSYGMAVRELILEPLGMHDTHLQPTSYDKHRLIRGHDSRGRPVPPFVWEGMDAAGTWRSTGADLLTFLRAQLGHFGEPWAALATMTTRPCAKLGWNTQVGLGWMLSAVKPQGQAVWHSGGTFGQHSMVAWSPAQLAAVVLLTDRAPPWWHHLVPGYQLENLPERLIAALSTTLSVE